MFSGLQSIQRAQAQEDSSPWWKTAVFYEVFVRSFYDSDGDGVGDFDGLTQRLDYLNDGDPTTATDLGVNALWLMPIMPSFSYHGYDVLDYYSVDPEYGTMEDFRELLTEAHARGIRVIIDLVINHTADDNPWFRASAEGAASFGDWYVWEDQDPGWRASGDKVVWHPRGGRFYYGYFEDGMPDLNYNNPAVTAQMYDVARFWLEEVGVDGFRLDAVKFLIEEGSTVEHARPSREWLTAFNAHVKSINPDAFVVGEIWSNTNLVVPYVEDNAVDIAFEFDLARTMLQSASIGRVNNLVPAIQNAVRSYPDSRFGAFLTNHDQNRAIFELRNHMERAIAAARLLLTSPGVPFMYYGEEIGMNGRKPDERIRTPMQWEADAATGGFTTGTPWQPLQEDADEVNVATQADDPASLLSAYRDLIRLRAELGLGQGLRDYVESAHRDVYSFIDMPEGAGGPAVLVIMNMYDDVLEDYALSADAALPVSGSWEVVVGPEGVVPPTLSADGAFVDYEPLPELEPYEMIILELSQ
ncbi:MAG: alpha-amylase [Chloroflexi bacterium]|nr:alpha-amylase [Chloroflexota bacterium]